MSEELSMWYEELTYSDAKDILREKLMNLKMNFIAAGYYLKYIRDNELYLEDGYTIIWEFAEDNYGIQKSTASRWMKMNDRFSEGGNTPILSEKYKAFGKSQLQEMLYLEDDQMDQVTPDMTVREIREVRTPEEVEESRCKDVCESVATSQQNGTCIHRPEFSCTLPEASKLAVRDGIDCNKKCCWDCPKRMECGYRCNSASGHLIEEQIPGQMSVEDFPEILPKREDADVSNDGVSIDELNLSVRTYNVLKRAGIETIEQIQEMSDVDLAMIRNFSKRCMDEVHSKLEEYAKNNSENPVHDIAQDETESVIDTEYKEIAAESTETEEICCQKAADLNELTFSQIAIRDYLEEEEETLAEYEKVNSEDGGLPHNLMMRQRMLVKALRLLLENEADHDDQEDDEPEEIEPVQPELPVLRNNEQRKEWLNEYKEWPVWFEVPEAAEVYHIFNLPDGSSIVICEYHMWLEWKERYADENPDSIGTREYLLKPGYRYLRDCITNTSALVEHLKNLQKGEKK